jgi:hypothetical protein
MHDDHWLVQGHNYINDVEPTDSNARKSGPKYWAVPVPVAARSKA